MDYLAWTLKRWPQIPSFALWRAIELRVLSRLQFEEPILDVGCGNGEFGEMLFGEGRRLVGVDLGLTEVREAKRSAAYVNVIRGDATCLPMRDRLFASVLANCVLEHIPEDVRAVSEMARVLKEGGQIVFTVPGPRFHEGLYNYQLLKARGEDEQAESYLRSIDQRLQHRHYRSREEWSAILTQAGLTVERIEPYLIGPALRIWDRLENYLTQPVMNVLSQRKLAPIILMPGALRRWLTYRYLVKYYRMEGPESELHGGWLVVGRKPEGR